jgi:hypothetical protein
VIRINRTQVKDGSAQMRERSVEAFREFGMNIVRTYVVKSIKAGTPSIAAHISPLSKSDDEVEAGARTPEDGLGCARAIRLVLGLEVLVGLLIYGIWHLTH